MVFPLSQGSSISVYKTKETKILIQDVNGDWSKHKKRDREHKGMDNSVVTAVGGGCGGGRGHSEDKWWWK